MHADEENMPIRPQDEKAFDRERHSYDNFESEPVLLASVFLASL